MELLFGFLTIGTIAILGAVSPGPDFAVVAKNSLLMSRKIGMWTALGVGTGIFVHVIYSLIGIGLIISKSILLFTIIKYAGALYLIYLGIQLLRSKKNELVITLEGENKTSTEAFWEGFLTNALNPKASLFFLGVFTQVVDPSTPFLVQIMYGLEIAAIVGCWFILLAHLLTIGHVQKRLSKISHHINRAMGGILVLLGLKVALS